MQEVDNTMLCVLSPLLRPDYEKGTPAAAPPPKPEQIQGRQEPTPGNTHRNTCARANSSHVQAN